MDGRLQQIAAAEHGLVLWAQARAAGVPVGVLRWGVRVGHLTRIARGAYVERSVWDQASHTLRHELAVRAACARSPGAVVAGCSAAVLLGLPLPPHAVSSPVLLSPRTLLRPEHGEVSAAAVSRRAWLDAGEVTCVRGLRVTVPVRTFVDVSRQLDLPWSLAVADAVRRTHRTTCEDLVAAASRNVRAPGHRQTLLAARHAKHLVESPLESLARGVQLLLGLPLPRVQAWVGDDRAELRVDMLVDEHATVVEADGRLKYDGPDAPSDRRWKDKRRQDRLLELGYDCHRFVAADLHRPVDWGRGLLRTFARSHQRRGLPVPDLRYPWA